MFEVMLDSALIAARLREAMVDEGLRPSDLARLVGESQQAVYSWTKTGRIAKGKLATVANAIRRPVWYFLVEDWQKKGITMSLIDLATELGLTIEELLQAAYAAAEVKRAMKPRPSAKLLAGKKGGR